MRARTWTFALTALLVVSTAACSSSKKDADDPDKWAGMSEDGADPDPDPKADPDPEPDPEPEPDGDDDDDDDDAPKPKPLTQDDDYEINHRDCDALAAAYGRAWKRDEMKKVHARNLPKPKFDKAEAEVDSGSQEMQANWQDECYKTVGTAYLRSRLKCALKAKSLQRFNNCMDGLAD